jgi:hypothetical protein
MQSSRPGKAVRRALPLALLAIALFMFFAPSAFALFTNGGFESGVFGPEWSKSAFYNYGLSGAQPYSGASIVRDPGGSDLTNLLGPYAPMSQADPYTAGGVSYPFSGNFCAVVNFSGWNYNDNSLAQQDVVSPSDVAPDGNVHVRFAWAAVVTEYGHPAGTQPYAYIALTNVTKGTTLYEAFHFEPGDVAWHDYYGTQYTDWNVTDIPVDSTAAAVGDTVKIEFIAAGCALGGDFGSLYVDHLDAVRTLTPHVTVANKDYDGTTAATITGASLDGVQPGDDVSLTGGTATFDSAAGGLDKTVTVDGLSLTGADAGWYALASTSAAATASICGVPTVTSTAASDLTASHAVSGGHVTWDGGYAVSERGVCWSASANPTIADSRTSDGFGAGSFVSALSGLTEGTTYHYRAYATNSRGTAYGDDSTFTASTTVPTTSATGLTDSSSWVASDPRSVTLTGDDGDGSGIAHTYYTIDGGGQQTYAGAFDISAEGPHWVTYWSVDLLGNAETPQTGYVNIDTSAPAVTPSGYDTAWHRHAVPVTITATDLLLSQTQTRTKANALGQPAPTTSGVKNIQYREGTRPWTTVAGGLASFTVATNGYHVFQYRATDNAGNVSQVRTFPVKIDTVKPVVTCITNTVVPQGSVAKLQYKLADNLSKTLTCRLIITQYGATKAVYQLGSKPTGQTLVALMTANLKPQWYYWRVVARDAAGNETWGVHHMLIIVPRQLRAT